MVVFQEVCPQSHERYSDSIIADELHFGSGRAEKLFFLKYAGVKAAQVDRTARHGCHGTSVGGGCRNGAADV